MEYRNLLYKVENGIATITFNRPKASNALVSGYGFEEMYDAFDRAAADPEAKVILLRGEGKNFCAGGDISQFDERLENGTFISEQEVRDGSRAMGRIRRSPKPTVAMIQGACVGAGMGVAMACDLRVLSETAIMSMAFIRMALSGDTGSIYNLLHAVGWAKTLEYMMLGDNITAQEAYQFGLATKVVAPEKLEEETMKLVNRLANGPTVAYAHQKELIWNISTSTAYDTYVEEEAVRLADCSRTEDFAEAVTAFLGKRKPVFKGK